MLRIITNYRRSLTNTYLASVDRDLQIEPVWRDLKNANSDIYDRVLLNISWDKSTYGTVCSGLVTAISLGVLADAPSHAVPYLVASSIALGTVTYFQGMNSVELHRRIRIAEEFDN